jgi:hypothetical protein
MPVDGSIDENIDDKFAYSARQMNRKNYRFRQNDQTIFQYQHITKMNALLFGRINAAAFMASFAQNPFPKNAE